MTYVLFPDYVISASDGDMHFVSAANLAQLYGVNLRECKVVRPNDKSYRKREGDIELRVKGDGDYSLPEPPEGAE